MASASSCTVSAFSLSESKGDEKSVSKSDELGKHLPVAINVNILLQVFNDMMKQGNLGVTFEDKGCSNDFCADKNSKPSLIDGWSKKKVEGKQMWLCKSCTSAYQKRQYCEYCKQIYTDTSDKGAVVDGLDWIQCETCKRWTHLLCERNNGIANIDILSLDPMFKYHCTSCKKPNKLTKKK